MTLSGLTGMRDGVSVDENRLKAQKLETACRDFEAILLNQMLQTMRQNLPEGGLFDASPQQKMYQSLFDEKMTWEIVQGGGGVGLADDLYRELAVKEKMAHYMQKL